MSALGASESKRCAKCNEEKAITEFHKAGKLANGEVKFAPRCKDCRSSLSPEERKLKQELEKAGLRLCIVCNEAKSVNDFYGLQKRCKQCLSIHRKNLHANDSDYRDRIKQLYQQQRRHKKLIVWDYLLENPCACGESDPLVLEFDHDDPSEKDFEISEATRGKSVSSLYEEMAKCTVRCANCHRKRTHAQLGWEMPYIDYDWSDIEPKRIERINRKMEIYNEKCSEEL